MDSNGSQPERPEEAGQEGVPRGVEPPVPVAPDELGSSKARQSPVDSEVAGPSTPADSEAEPAGDEASAPAEVSDPVESARSRDDLTESDEGEGPGAAAALGRSAAEELAAAAFTAPEGDPAAEDADIAAGADAADVLEGEGVGPRGRKRGLAGRFKEGLVDLATATYDKRADDMQGRALSALREAIAQEGERLAGLVTSGYDARADDLEQRAIRAIRKIVDEEADRMLEMAKETYDARADDLEERAARALRAALIHESRRLQAVIEHSVVVKRKEVRLSLLVLVVANLIYLAVYWITG